MRRFGFIHLFALGPVVRFCSVRLVLIKNLNLVIVFVGVVSGDGICHRNLEVLGNLVYGYHFVVREGR